MAFCPNCGTQTEGKFCPKCGTAIGVAPGGPPPGNAAPPPYQPPPPYQAAPPYQAQQAYQPPPTASGMTDNVAGALCYSATLLRARSRVDDALDVFAVHGIGGMFGAIATGVLASSTVQAAYSGLIDGNPQQVVTQAIAVVATIAYAVVGTYLIVKVVDVLLGIRVKPEVEEMGLDLSVHGEAAYQV